MCLKLFPPKFLGVNVAHFLISVVDERDPQQSGQKNVSDRKVLIRYAGESDMWQKSTFKEVCSLFTMHEETLLFSHIQALLLQAFIKGGSEPFDETKNAVDPFVLNHILEVEETIDKPFVASVAKFDATRLNISCRWLYL